MLYSCTISRVDQIKKRVDVYVLEKETVLTDVALLASAELPNVGDLVYVLARESNNSIDWCIVLGKELN